MSNKISNLHQAARDFARFGIPVFPCVAGSKAPATANGFKDATTDLEQIDRWWQDDPQYNVAIEPGRVGWCVIDLDPPVGEASWATLLLEHGRAPDTYEVRTPRGGRHLYFKGSLPPSASKLGEKIDTRGNGSYVLVPPSYVAEYEAHYHVLADRDVALLPVWIDEAIRRDRERAKASVAELDLPTSKARVTSLLRNYVELGDVAVEGQGGDARTYQLAAEVLNLGVSPEVAHDLILDHWNPHCIPPWPKDELRTKVANAAEYAQNEGGSWAVPPGDTIWQGGALDKLISLADDASLPGGTTAAKRSRFTPLRLDELADALKEPSWIIPGVVQAEGITQLVGKQKSFKTFIALDMALSITAGVRWCDQEVVQGAVVYAVGENASALGLKHVAAWRLLHQSTDQLPFFLVAAVPKAMFSEETEELIAQIKQAHIKPSLVVIDTATRAMRGLDENSAKDMGVFSQACDNIRDALGCAVLVVRHTGKDRDKGGRGSNVFDGDVDATLHVTRADKTMAVELRVEEIRNAAEREYPYTFQAKMVGPSLVMQPTDSATHRRLTVADELFEPRKVGRALAELNAYGVDHGVTSYVLADRMLEQRADQSAEARVEAIEAAVRQLRDLSKGSLKAYAEKTGRQIQWWLPAKASDD